jgi:glycosyltransferase involved in cell wall biosynthesis
VAGPSIVKVLVTHPGRQHSHQAAVALEQAGMLAGYWAGVPSLARQGRLVPPGLWRRLVRYAPVALPAERVRWFPWTPILRRLGDRLLPRRAALRVDFLACRLFDRWAARGLSRLAPDAVLACEISALSTFGAARRLGIATLLDAPSLHHLAQDRLHGFVEPARLHRRITRVKDEEIARADHVLTVSELAQQSYLAAGLEPRRVHSVTLGVDTELFAPAGEQRCEAATGEPRLVPTGVTFLFPGAMIRRKGFDVLLEAFARVRAAEPGARLVVTGPPRDETDRLGDPPPAAIALTGALSQADFAAELRRADCLVLPSRNDSFGMAVVEALASGVPVVVSDMVGARDLVEEGRTGWVVPAGDAAALSERLLACARERGTLAGMREACRRAAAAATWPAYHERLAALVQGLLTSGRRSGPPRPPQGGEGRGEGGGPRRGGSPSGS